MECELCGWDYCPSGIHIREGPCIPKDPPQKSKAPSSWEARKETETPLGDLESDLD